MSFQWPAMLFGLVVLPVLGWVYLWLLRRPPRRAVRFTQVALLGRALRQTRPWRRHLPAALLGSALVCIILALARPVAPLPVPSAQNTVILSIDVSRSMLAEDMPPNRMEAAKSAAREFVESLPRGLKVGLVTFSSYAQLVVPPTADRARVLEAIGLLTTEYATAIGDGLVEAVYALPGRQRPLDPMSPPPPPKESAPPATVVLLSDGQSNRGVVPQDAARLARDQRVKVFTVGIGTPEGTFLNLGGRSIWVRLDEDTLREMAEIAGGSYYHARSVLELRQVYRRLSRVVGWESRPTEVSALGAGLALVLLVGALVSSLAVVHRIT
ncbi:MAG: VWA domain-containing protein [Armatimonadota bacterium]|nr:VWA domain-containing protein [Armatimonadota bacterium]MDR7452226.1 VWA domain-containing protein [Armatimonadota bacterium]MDR7466679.1 VWA domain-containing protein [Armatimonadota bacterium]MDR7492847.1 VWA domain-containing protein [Armatimonadota bacterium]MDR7498623.1 VWA domain-containing protein [Armatimonadota bacterium]